MKNIFQIKVLEKLEIHISGSVNFFFEYRTVYGIIWKNVAGRGRPQMTLRLIRIACWIPKASNTHPEYAILIAFPQHQ